MQSPSSGSSAHGTSWQWDEETDGGEATGDVVAGGRERVRPSRRRLLLAGAGVLAAGGAAWAFGRSGGGGAGPSPAPPGPAPTALSGPTPLWSYRGPEPMTPERLTDPPGHPVFLSRKGLQVLDPARGVPGRLLVFDPPDARSWPSDLDTLGKVVFGPEHLFTTFQGHVEARHLTDPAADWSLPLPDELQGQTRLAGYDGLAPGVLYGYSWGRAKADGSLPDHRLFALRVSDRSLLWSVRTEQVEQPVTPAAHSGADGRLACVRFLGGRAELVVRDAATGRELWTGPGEEELRWCVSDSHDFFVPDGNSGVRVLRAAGEPGWTYSPARGESRRALPPVQDGPRVFVPWDQGLVTCHDPGSGALLWSCRLPFPLDRRNRPLAAGRTLYVPGTATGGVCAIDAATGELGWTFHDSAPGKDVWTVASDGGRLYVGHDDVLHALPLG
ncbi:PQQ-binding-like beta-propeller repeat protein [Kitasatospora sp. NPDC018619]|uniref:outer membrane protein assembly factor BamB family protein n=1 Tax=unclassified Kitasatospora TaxID=2633591 RepID=UPI0037B0D810